MRQRQTNPRMMESLLHLDPRDIFQHRHSHQHQEEQQMSLKQLEVMKTEHEERLTEIEAEYTRSKKESFQTPQWSMEDPNFHGHTISAFVYGSHVSQKPAVPTNARLKYESKFEEYLHKKYGSAAKGILQGTQIQTYQGKARPEVEPFLSYIFKKIDRTGTVDKVELMQELHENPELARIFGFEAKAMNPDYMTKFETLFQSLGSADEVSQAQFIAFFSGAEARQSSTVRHTTPRRDSPVKESRKESPMKMLSPERKARNSTT